MPESSKTTLVTGASGELGSALISHLVQAGEQVIAVDRPKARARLEALAQLSSRVQTLEIDTSRSDAWSEANLSTRQGGTPDGAVLTAGAYAGGKALAEEDAATTLTKLLDSNLVSAYQALSALLKVMVPAGRGSIVLIGSRAAVRPWESGGSGAYAASKAALVALAQSSAAEVIGTGVRINVVLPSTIDTAPNRAAMPGADTSGWVSKQSLCEVIGFLLSPLSRDISGAVIPVFGSRAV